MRPDAWAARSSGAASELQSPDASAEGAALHALPVQRRTRGAAGGLGALALLTLLAWALALGAPARTRLQVTITERGAVAAVNGVEAPLDWPSGPGAVAGGRVGWYVAPARESLTYQAADPAAPLPVLGVVGEWLQDLRPAPSWQWAPGQAAPAALRPGSVLRADLVGGRGPAALVLGPEGAGYAVVLRPERGVLGWWRVAGGAPAELLAETRYGPSAWATLADLAQEAALVGTAALAVAGVALLLAPLGARLRPQRPCPRLAWPAMAALAGVGGLVALAVALGPLEAIPHTQDEVAYLWQAKIFAVGRVVAPAPPDIHFFEEAVVEIDRRGWFSKYPPGWPLLLAPGAAVGAPWLINPFCAVAALLLIAATAARLYGRDAGIWAAALGGASPFLLFMSGSYMAHPATMLATAGALYAFVRAQQAASAQRRRLAPGGGWFLASGLCLGWCFISREATALGVAIPFVAWAIIETATSMRDRRAGGRSLARYGLMALGALPPLALLAAVDQAQQGSPLRLAQELVGAYNRLGFGPGVGPSPGGHTPTAALYNALVYLRSLQDVLFGWPAPLTLVPLALGVAAAWGRGRAARWDLFLIAGWLGLVGVYFAYWAAQTLYGPRYWYEGLPFLLLLSARGLQALGRGAGTALRAWAPAAAAGPAAGWAGPLLLFGFGLLFNLTQRLPAQFHDYTGYNDMTAAAVRQVAAARLDHALVFVRLQPAAKLRDYDKVFFANDPLLQGPVVYARDLGPARNRQLLAAFPDRTPYLLPLSGPPRPGVGP